MPGQKFKRVPVLEQYALFNQQDSSGDFSRMGGALWGVVASEKVFAKTAMPRRSRAGEE